MGFDLSKLGIQPATVAPVAPVAPAVPAASVEVVPARPSLTQRLAGLGAPKASTAPAPAPVQMVKAVSAVVIAQNQIPENETQPIIVEKPAEMQLLTPVEGFKAKLAALDALVGDSLGISVLELAAARQYVAAVMVELREFPEYDGFIIDKDIHNIMMYVQASNAMTQNAFVLTTEKRTVKAAKAAKAESFDFNLDGLIGTPMPKTKPKFDFVGLEAFAGSNLDAVPVMTARKRSS